MYIKQVHILNLCIYEQWVCSEDSYVDMHEFMYPLSGIYE